MKLRKSPRLKHFDYAGQFAYSLTLVTRQRIPAFRDSSVTKNTLECLNQACQRYGFTLHAYCFMPDHLHLLVSGEQGSQLKEFARYFKQLSSHRLKGKHDASLWQISYYDHVLRRDEDVSNVAAYIWDNPLRAGLVERRGDYSFSGPRTLLEQA